MNNVHTSKSAFNRTQIYLTQAQQAQLDQLSQQNACSKSELIRKAVDQFIATQKNANFAKNKAQTKGLKLMAGLWRDRPDMEDPVQYVHQLRQPRFKPC